MTSLRVDFREVDSLAPSDLQAWQRLAASAAEPNPFFEPALAVPAGRSLPDRAGVRLLCVFDGDDLLFAAPVHWPRRWRRVRMSLVSTWCHAQCFLGVPLVVADGRAEAAWRLAVDALAQHHPKSRFLVLELMTTDGPAFDALQRATSNRVVRCYERYTRAYLYRESLDEEGLAPQRGRRRRELERRSRKVEQATGAPFATKDVSHDPAAAADFVELEGAGWVGRAGTALRSDPGTAAFALQAADRLRENNQLVLLATTAGRGVAAELFAFQSHGTLFMFKIAYDEDLAPFSPGTQLVYDLTRWFADEGSLTQIDSCAHPDNEFINRLLPDRRPFATVLVALDHSIGALAVASFPNLVKWARRLRRNR